jgi:YVTN family beta-propeller protein
MPRERSTRAERGRRRRRRGIGRLVTVIAVLAVAGGAVAWAADRDGDTPVSHRAVKKGSARSHHPAVTKVARPTRLVERSVGSLASPVQDAASAAIGQGRVLLLGGLSSADTSKTEIRLVAGGRDTALGTLPFAVHDSAAVRLGDSAYLFGGGNTVQLDQIVRVDPATGRTSVVGRLPAPSSDQAAASVGNTAYVVGGYTGTAWLSTIVAWRPGGSARVVAHLPTPLRYAAVGAAGGKVVIAGGSVPSGNASRVVYSFDPASGAVSRLGVLPAPTTHAAAAAIGDVVYVIGGRGAVLGSATTRIVAVDPVRPSVRTVGRLAAPTSDLAAIALGQRILLAGGRSGATTSGLHELVPTKAKGLATVTPAAPAVPRADPTNVYAYDGRGMLSPAVRAVPPRIYVPNSNSNTVDVIDPRTYHVVEHFSVGALPQHVTPSYDLKTLWVLNDVGNSLTPINPRTTKPGRPIPVDDPYNMYYTPNGRFAIVVAERNSRLDFRYAHTMKLQHALSVPCRGVDHMDFSADGRYLIASCEFSSQMIKVDVRTQRVVGVLTVAHGRGMPQDVKLSPDGKVFYVADMASNGLWELDGARLKVIGFIPTGLGVHGLYPSRDATRLYATNRGEGSISVISFARRRVITKWRLPGGGSPDMGGVSADGKVLWLSGRYSAEVYAIRTTDGKLLARIPVGSGPHGLCVWPQPGRYSLGHTGILR